jgi:hypothetical protein
MCIERVHAWMSPAVAALCVRCVFSCLFALSRFCESDRNRCGRLIECHCAVNRTVWMTIISLFSFCIVLTLTESGSACSSPAVSLHSYIPLPSTHPPTCLCIHPSLTHTLTNTPYPPHPPSLSHPPAAASATCCARVRRSIGACAIFSANARAHTPRHSALRQS